VTNARRQDARDRLEMENAKDKKKCVHINHTTRLF
jgi:hypothetical protein